MRRVRSQVIVRRLELPLGSVTYLERDGARETLVLLHGFASTKYAWLSFIQHMPRRYRILAFDLSGHGDNPINTDDHYSLEHYTNVLHAALQALGIKRFHLGGNSLGGLVATHYALNYSEEVITLGLIAPAGVYPPTSSEFQRLHAAGKNPLIVTTKNEFEYLLKLMFVKRPFMLWPTRSVLTKRLIKRKEHTRQLWDNLEESFNDISVQLEKIKSPCFLLWGDQDKILHVSSVQVYQQHLSNVKTIIMKNIGHLPMIENPAQTARHYLWFLRQIEQSIV